VSGATYQDVLQAIRNDVDAASVEAMIADDHAALTDAQMSDLRGELAARDEVES
jgi:hypothetical protein